MIPLVAIEAALAPAKSAGRQLLTEPEALAVVSALGLSTPSHQVVHRFEELDLDALPDRVVVKAVIPGLVHKTEAGAVRLCPKDQLQAVMAAMPPAEQYLVAAFVAHDMEPGGELLVSVRWTREHGVVATLALGGVTAEALSQQVSISAPDLPVRLDPKLVALASGRLRGRQGRCSEQAVTGLVQRLLAAASLFPEQLDEIELNPVVFADGAWVALDAVVRRGGSPLPDPRPAVDLSPLLRPETVGIVGASARGMNPGRTILRAMLAAGYPAERLRVIKPGLDQLDGCPCVDDLDRLGLVDLLVLAVPGSAVPDLWEEALACSRSVLLIPGGTGELAGTEHVAQQLRDGLRAARERGHPVRVIGGNSLGLQSRSGGVDTLFVPADRVGASAVDGPLALVSNSGALALALQSALPVAPRIVLTLGNQLDLSVADAVVGLLDEPDAQVIALYIEGLPDGDGQRLVEATRALTQAGRTVIVYRAGRTSAGRAATASHTAALAGDASVSHALLSQAGARIADSLDDLVDLCTLAASGPPPGGRRLAVMSNAGFECVAAADHLGPLTLADLAAETLASLDSLLVDARLGGLVAAHNPLDLTPIATDVPFVAAARRLLADPGVDLGVIGCIPFTQALATLPGEGDGLVEGLGQLAADAPVPWVAVIDGGPLYDPLRQRLRAAGVVVFPRMDRAVRALGRW